MAIIIVQIITSNPSSLAIFFCCTGAISGAGTTGGATGKSLDDEGAGACNGFGGCVTCDIGDGDGTCGCG